VDFSTGLLPASTNTSFRVVIEFINVEAAYIAHESAGYQEALVALDGGASRDFRIVEGVE
jgi:uncharacterized protein (DUF1330 family)